MYMSAIKILLKVGTALVSIASLHPLNGATKTGNQTGATPIFLIPHRMSYGTTTGMVCLTCTINNFYA